MRTLALLLVLGAHAGGWPEVLPSFRLRDHLDMVLTHDALRAQGAVVVVTAPTQAQGGTQRAWHEVLKANAGHAGPMVVMVEDMTQSWFRHLVIARMKEENPTGGRVKLLLDEDASVRKAFGVTEGATVVFAFAPGGRRVRVETGTPTLDRAKGLLSAASQ